MNGWMEAVRVNGGGGYNGLFNRWILPALDVRSVLCSFSAFISYLVHPSCTS